MAQQDRSQRPYDFVVVGATGFVGRLLLEELACDYKIKTMKWAIAGPNTDRLDFIKMQLADKFNPSCSSIPVLSLDVGNQASVDRVAASCRVIIDLAGPYKELGAPVVDACVRLGTHMIDITGETTYVREIIDTYHDEAARKGISIITSCGWEAAASDLGVFLATEYAKERFGPTDTITHAKTVYQVYQGMAQAFSPFEGGFGGGTWLSLMNMFRHSPWSELAAMQSPYYLCPRDMPAGKDLPDIFVPGWVPEMKEFSAANILSVSNRRIVHRSNALLKYGEDLKYSEHTATYGPISAFFMSLFNLIFVIMLSIPLLHPLLRLFANRPRQGPSRITQLKGCWKNITFAYTKGGGKAMAIIGDAGRDPGYWSTARIALEAGLALAYNQEELHQHQTSKTLHGGVLTPAAGLGNVLVNRLKHAGFSIIVREHHGMEYGETGKKKQGYYRQYAQGAPSPRVMASSYVSEAISTA